MELGFGANICIFSTFVELVRRMKSCAPEYRVLFSVERKSPRTTSVALYWSRGYVEIFLMYSQSALTKIPLGPFYLQLDCMLNIKLISNPFQFISSLKNVRKKGTLSPFSSEILEALIQGPPSKLLRSHWVRHHATGAPMRLVHLLCPYPSNILVPSNGCHDC